MRLFTLVFIAFFPGCFQQSNAMNNLSAISQPQVSPSGKYYLKVIEGYNDVQCYRFEIVEKGNDKVVFLSGDCFRARDVNFFMWDDAQDIVWVYSGDIGTFFWVKDAYNQWSKHIYVFGEGKGVPELLKKLRPQFLPT